MTGRAAFGIVTLAAADLRREPRHAAELLSQLLLGESVAILASRERGAWLRVRGLHDDYAGWMRAWALKRVSGPGLADWRRRARARVRAPLETLRAVSGERGPLMPVFLGARLEPLGRVGSRRRVRLPDGRIASLPASALGHASRSDSTLRARIRTLLGVPYLWGGRTPAGFDCSGFTQIVLAEQGVLLPRDARLQYREAKPLERGETPREGDLVFFGRPREAVSHVGIMLDRCSFVHCRGWVRHASLDPDSALYEKDLAAQIRGVRRPA